MERTRREFIVRGNELIINLTAQSLKDDFLGRVCLTSRNEHCLLNQRLARLTPAFGVPKFFLYVFKSSMFRRFVGGLNTGSLIQHMFTRQLREFSFPLPPTQEQSQIVRETERRLDAASRMAEALQRQLSRSLKARSSILNEAFSGKLVPHNADDGDGAALLSKLKSDRIRAAQTLRGATLPKTPSLPKKRRSLLSTLREHKRPMTPEELFRRSGHTQDSVDEFFAELRELTASPPQILQDRARGGRITLRATT